MYLSTNVQVLVCYRTSSAYQTIPSTNGAIVCHYYTVVCMGMSLAFEAPLFNAISFKLGCTDRLTLPQGDGHK
jgi:hypothetical protein